METPTHIPTIKNPAAVALGSIKSAKKAASSARNGKLGGRPRKDGQSQLCAAMDKHLAERTAEQRRADSATINPITP